jgi:DNA polymerase-3 subunit beta
MKLTVDTKALSDALDWANKAIPQKPNHPILANFKIEAGDSNLEVTGFDLSMAIKATVEANVDRCGSVTIPAKLFTETIKHLPNGELTLEVDNETNDVKIISSGKYDLRGLSTEEYPEIPLLEANNSLEISVENLLQGSKTISTVSTDETKQQLCGVDLKFSDKGIKFAATNGHLLMVIEVENEDFEGDESEIQEIIIPGRAFREVKKMITKFKEKRDDDTPVLVGFDDRIIIFSYKNQQVQCRKLDGAFPAYEQLIPKNHATLVTADRRTFIGSLERMEIIAKQKNHIVCCDFDAEAQQIKLSVEAADVGKAEEYIPAQISVKEPVASDDDENDDGDDKESFATINAVKEPITVAFNCAYIIEGLEEMETSEVQIKIQESTIAPIIISPLGGIKMTFLLMPVNLRK